MKTDIDDGLSPFTPRKRNYQDDSEDYTPARRRRDYRRTRFANNSYEEPSSTKHGHLVYSVDDDGSYEPDYYDEYEDSDYNYERPHARSRSQYDDEGYEDYGDLGSNYDITSEPNYGYDDTERYEDYKQHEARTYSPSDRGAAPRNLDFSDARTANYPLGKTQSRSRVQGTGQAPNSLDWSNSRTIAAPSERYTQNDKDIEDYLGYIERYDKGEIDNHDMSRVQRAFANKPFWQTFRPSRDLIQKYGSGNRSTRWPMFENKNGKWQPIIWRND